MEVVTKAGTRGSLVRMKPPPKSVDGRSAVLWMVMMNSSIRVQRMQIESCPARHHEIDFQFFARSSLNACKCGGTAVQHLEGLPSQRCTRISTVWSIAPVKQMGDSIQTKRKFHLWGTARRIQRSCSEGERRWYTQECPVGVVQAEWKVTLP